MIEENPFSHFVPSGARKLILGSFPCFNGKDYGGFFYSGSGRNHFWLILSAITGLPVNNIKEKQLLCTKHHIALSDVALKIARKKNNCSDANLDILEYNYKGIHHCLKAGVTQIYFTSRFVETHFKKMLPGVELPFTLLPSPSPAANRHIGGLEQYKELLQKKAVKDVFDFRLQQYRELLFGKGL